MEQIEIMRREREEYVGNCKREYQQLAEVMAGRLEEMQGRLQGEQATAKKIKMQMDKEVACFNLAKENMQDKVNQLTMTNELLTKELEARRALASNASPRTSKYKFKLEDLPN